MIYLETRLLFLRISQKRHTLIIHDFESFDDLHIRPGAFSSSFLPTLLDSLRTGVEGAFATLCLRRELGFRLCVFEPVLAAMFLHR
jgi:hypothetical protein